ncbi:hypothetical protein B0H15DRAFT_889207 [Mycena belliarum]|uniref:Uncharacterized protein n=1 Tax=Mycena belliarum TaxID=1033014 RepID=A0AAD6XJP7_9AGAR|nr:hypothetical protein B0H15DRAFT_889207 [Mycena belliae]
MIIGCSPQTLFIYAQFFKNFLPIIRIVFWITTHASCSRPVIGPVRPTVSSVYGTYKLHTYMCCRRGTSLRLHSFTTKLVTYITGLSILILAGM